MSKTPLRDRIAVPFINFLVRILTSKQHQKRLRALMDLGHIKAAELLIQRHATDAKLAKEPGMTPDGKIVASDE